MMPSRGGPTRRAKLAVTAVSGGVLAMIWSGVWYAAASSGRVEASPRALFACRLVFLAGVLATAVGFVYLRRRKLSVIDGSTTHLSLPPASDTALTPVTRPERQRV